MVEAVLFPEILIPAELSIRLLGRWGQVALTDGTVGVLCQTDGSHAQFAVADTTQRVKLGLKGLFQGGGQQKVIRATYDSFYRAHYIIDHHAIGPKDIDDLPNSVRLEKDRIQLASALAYPQAYWCDHCQDTPYRLGLVMSDFLDVIPVDLAARILLSASCSEISDAVAQRSEKLHSTDVKGNAVEAVVLLSPQKRAEIFGVMAQMDNRGLDGDLYQFY